MLNKIATIFCLCLLVGCTTTDPPPVVGDAGGGAVRQRNEGYSLLYKLMTDESDVDKLLLVKDASDAVKEQVKLIAAFATDCKRELDVFAKVDRLLAFDTPDLPAVEQSSRDIARDEDSHKLLFTSGKEFELHLIYTQAQAMEYSARLSQALAEKETDSKRKTFLDAMSHRSHVFADGLMKMMTVTN